MTETLSLSPLTRSFPWGQTSHIYHSGSHFTTVDYIITIRLASEFITRSECKMEHPLNVSDHLALSITMSLNPSPVIQRDLPLRIGWNRSTLSGEIDKYEASVRDIVPFLVCVRSSTSLLTTSSQRSLMGRRKERIISGTTISVRCVKLVGPPEKPGNRQVVHKMANLWIT